LAYRPGNNPVNFVDPTGLKVTIAPGTDPVILDALQDILQNSSYGASEYDALNADPNINFQISSGDLSGSPDDQDLHLGSTLPDTPDPCPSQVDITLDPDQIVLSDQSFEQVLGHEFAHAETFIGGSRLPNDAANEAGAQAAGAVVAQQVQPDTDGP